MYGPYGHYKREFNNIFFLIGFQCDQSNFNYNLIILWHIWGFLLFCIAELVTNRFLRKRKGRMFSSFILLISILFELVEAKWEKMEKKTRKLV